jgi:hypothetical protein
MGDVCVFQNIEDGIVLSMFVLVCATIMELALMLLRDQLTASAMKDGLEKLAMFQPVVSSAPFQKLIVEKHHLKCK